MPSRLRAMVLLLAGLLLSAGSAVHAFLAWPHLRGDLVRDHASPGLVGALSLGWHFGSVAMLAFGLVVLSAGIAVWRGDRVSTSPLWIIAVACIAFGLAGFSLYGHSPHLLGFALLGALVASGTPIRSV
jgi:hypothetical protein